MKNINPLFLSGCLFFSLPAISATLSGTLAPTVVPLANGGQANIAVSNTDPNLFTVSGDRIRGQFGYRELLYGKPVF